MIFETPTKAKAKASPIIVHESPMKLYETSKEKSSPKEVGVSPGKLLKSSSNDQIEDIIKTRCNTVSKQVEHVKSLNRSYSEIQFMVQQAMQTTPHDVVMEAYRIPLANKAQEMEIALRKVKIMIHNGLAFEADAEIKPFPVIRIPDVGLLEEVPIPAGFPRTRKELFGLFNSPLEPGSTLPPGCIEVYLSYYSLSLEGNLLARQNRLAAELGVPLRTD